MKLRAAAAASALALAASFPAFGATCQPDRVILGGADRQVELSVEIADDPAERAQGLMFRRDMPAGRGMLFIYEFPQPVSFWMRNTLIPLDMIFMDAQGSIRHIRHAAVPLDETPIPGHVDGDPEPERLMILEIAGGEADRLGLQEGMAMAFPGLDQSRAAAPCQ